MTPLILTYDMGTQSARAMLVDQFGNIVKKTQKRYDHPYFSLNPGWTEQDPLFYWNSLCEVSLRLRQESGELWDDIIAVTATTIRDTCVCVDKDGNPLRDAIVWADKRETDGLNPLPFGKKILFSLVGMTDTAELQRRRSPCNWIRINEPEIWAKTYKFLLLSCFINFKLTGNFVDSCANLMGHVPFDSKGRKWQDLHQLTRCLFDVESEKLCDVIEPGELVGYITSKAAEQTGAPVGAELIATGSDKGCETLGLSCCTPDKAALSFGTTATVQFTTDFYMEALPFIPAFPAVLRNHYNPEVQISRGYWLLSWFKREFAAKEVEEAFRLGTSPEALLNKRLREVPPGCDGLVVAPYFTPGVVMPKARGAIIGFSDIHTRIHIYRAIIEGINFALMDGLYTMEKRGHVKIQELFVAGGGAQSDEICQITANMFGLPVHRIQTHEASGLGSSMVAFLSKGIFTTIDQAVLSMIHITDTFIPDEEEHELYETLFHEVFNKIFPRLLPLYKKAEIYKPRISSLTKNLTYTKI